MLKDIPTDEYEIDPVDEADRLARLQCKGMQYFTVHREVKLRIIGGDTDDE